MNNAREENLCDKAEELAKNAVFVHSTSLPVGTSTVKGCFFLYISFISITIITV